MSIKCQNKDGMHPKWSTGTGNYLRNNLIPRPKIQLQQVTNVYSVFALRENHIPVKSKALRVGISEYDGDQERLLRNRKRYHKTQGEARGLVVFPETSLDKKFLNY